jgi:hypothetical protein
VVHGGAATGCRAAMRLGAGDGPLSVRGCPSTVKGHPKILSNRFAESIFGTHPLSVGASAPPPVRDQGPGSSLPGPDAGHPLQAAGGHHGRNLDVPATCPIGRSTPEIHGHSRTVGCTVHLRTGRQTRCANRPSKQRVGLLVVCRISESPSLVTGLQVATTWPSASSPCSETRPVSHGSRTAKRLTPMAASSTLGASMSHRSPTSD